MKRADLIRLADGYFSTLENNDGKLVGVRFSANATSVRNGVSQLPGPTSPSIQKLLETGFFRFNSRVRDRDFVVIDEVRGIVMARAFIDHKGRMDRYKLADGTEGRSPYREPQTWSMLETFKMKKGEITHIEAVFVQVPYYMQSPWTRGRDTRQAESK